MLRVFVAATPRTGSTWFRKVLAECLGAGHNSFILPLNIDWDELPEDCIVVMHRRRTAAFEGYMRERHFRLLTLVRHPLDVLLSILVYARWHSDDTAMWVEGECGNEKPIVGAGPTSEAFLRYALSWRAAALFDVSLSWTSRAQAVVYERLVAEPVAAFSELCAALGREPRVPVAEVVARHTPDAMRAVAEHHVWHARPGLWRHLVVPEFARLIHDRHPEAFRSFGYDADADPTLTVARAEANWAALCAAQAPEALGTR